jgi:hypothetical protein
MSWQRKAKRPATQLPTEQQGRGLIERMLEKKSAESWPLVLGALVCGLVLGRRRRPSSDRTTPLTHACGVEVSYI